MGLPCTGKSTLLKEWEERGGSVVPEFVREVPLYVRDAWKSDPDVQLEAQKWILDQYRQKDEFIKGLDYDGPLLVERSPLDAVIYSRSFGGKVALFTDSEVVKRAWVPGKIILLKASEEVLRERLMKERGFTYEEWQQDLAFSKVLESHYRSFEAEHGISSINTQQNIKETMYQLMTTMREGTSYHIETLIASRLSKERAF